jgi:hypothetical protein
LLSPLRLINFLAKYLEKFVCKKEDLSNADKIESSNKLLTTKEKPWES